MWHLKIITNISKKKKRDCYKFLLLKENRCPMLLILILSNIISDSIKFLINKFKVYFYVNQLSAIIILRLVFIQLEYSFLILCPNVTVQYIVFCSYLKVHFHSSSTETNQIAIFREAGEKFVFVNISNASFLLICVRMAVNRIIQRYDSASLCLRQIYHSA